MQKLGDLHVGAHVVDEHPNPALLLQRHRHLTQAGIKRVSLGHAGKVIGQHLHLHAFRGPAQDVRLGLFKLGLRATDNQHVHPSARQLVRKRFPNARGGARHDGPLAIFPHQVLATTRDALGHVGQELGRVDTRRHESQEPQRVLPNASVRHERTQHSHQRQRHLGHKAQERLLLHVEPHFAFCCCCVCLPVVVLRVEREGVSHEYAKSVDAGKGHVHPSKDVRATQCPSLPARDVASCGAQGTSRRVGYNTGSCLCLGQAASFLNQPLGEADSEDSSAARRRS